MTEPRPNRYAGRCCRCDAWVHVGAGSLTADNDLVCAGHGPGAPAAARDSSMAAGLAGRLAGRTRAPRRPRPATKRRAQLDLWRRR